jgi:hypothetical protein
MLKGAPELRRRLKAIRQVFKPAGRQWADATVIEAKRRIAVNTGKTRASIRRKNSSQRKATVVGNYPVNFIDAGVKAHDIKPRNVSTLKFDIGGQTIFTKKVHKRATPARPFKKEAAQAGLRKVDIIGDLIELWNKAA